VAGTSRDSASILCEFQWLIAWYVSRSLSACLELQEYLRIGLRFSNGFFNSISEDALVFIGPVAMSNSLDIDMTIHRGVSA
jgi:hypothetical protein